MYMIKSIYIYTYIYLQGLFLIKLIYYCDYFHRVYVCWLLGYTFPISSGFIKVILRSKQVYRRVGAILGKALWDENHAWYQKRNNKNIEQFGEFEEAHTQLFRKGNKHLLWWRLGKSCRNRKKKWRDISKLSSIV